MKKPQPDLKDVLLPRYIDKLAFVRKFVRYWGVTTINGVRVLTPRKYFYPYMDNSTVKLTRFLKIYSNLKNARMKGVDNAWLYLNYKKASSLNFDKTILAYNLETLVGNGIQVRLVIGPRLKSNSLRWASTRSLEDVPINTDITNQEGIINEIINEYPYYWENGYIIKNSRNYDLSGQYPKLLKQDASLIYADMLAKYILFSKDVPHTVTKVIKTYTNVDIPYEHYDSIEDEYVTSYNVIKAKAFEVSIDIPKYNFNEQTDIVNKIYEDTQYAKSNPFKAPLNTRFLVKTITSHPKTVYDNFSDDSDYYEDSRTYQEIVFNDDIALWYDPYSFSFFGMGSVKYLREEALLGNILTLDQKIKLINSVIDTDYTEKDTGGFWSTLISVVMVVVSVALAIPTGGASLSGVAAAMAVATTISVAAVYISIAAAAATAMGYTGVAKGLANFLKAAAPLIVVATIVNIYGAMQNLANKGAQEIAKETGTTIAKDTVADITVDNVSAGIESMFSDMFSSSTTDITMDYSVKILNMVVDAYEKQDQKDLQKKIKRAEAELAKYAEAKEGSETRNLLLDLMKVQFNPLNRDYSFYDSIYDRPYERWATEYHTGNICATTVNALWTKET